MAPAACKVRTAMNKCGCEIIDLMKIEKKTGRAFALPVNSGSIVSAIRS